MSSVSHRSASNGATAVNYEVSERRQSNEQRLPARAPPEYFSLHFMMPLALVLVCPITIMLLSYIIVELNGSGAELLTAVRRDGFFELLRLQVWGPYIFGSAFAWKIIIPYASFQLLLMRLVPGKTVSGPVSPSGFVPTYKENGLSSYLLTLSAYFVCSRALNLFNPVDLYEHYLELAGAMNLFTLFLCVLLYAKGRLYPTAADRCLRGSVVTDYFWGTELYPRILGWDIKQFTNCRFGMMSWALLILCYAEKQYYTHGLSDSMIVAVALQLMYVTKFFYWEIGYMKTLDIMHDMAGFYLVSKVHAMGWAGEYVSSTHSEHSREQL